MRFSWVLAILASQQTVHLGVSATAVSAPVPSSPAPAQENQGNPATQLVGYVKDSLVRTATGAKEMWGNHGRCKEIRAKQKDYRDKLKSQWELQEKNLSQKEMRTRLAAVNGGITYDEFMFLAKGKEDRSRLMNLVFLMWGAPRVLPYALMFYPNILPSPFAPLPDASGKETKLEKISRQRSHAVISTLLELENAARQVPYLSKLNIFGKKAQERRMNSVDQLGRSLGEILSTPGTNGGAGAEMLLDRLDSLLYTKNDDGFTRAEKRFIGVPGAIVVGLMNSIQGPGLFNGVMPNFMRRGSVAAHVQKITEADNFLVNENVDLDILSTSQLLEACNDRLIGACGRRDEELRQDLSDWLNLAVTKPKARTEESGEFFNGNLARAALMGFYSLEASRDARCTSYLPRCLFQGKLFETSTNAGEKSKKR